MQTVAGSKRIQSAKSKPGHANIPQTHEHHHHLGLLKEAVAILGAFQLHSLASRHIYTLSSERLQH